MPAQDTVARLNAALAGRYRVERELGEGGMATVYLAADLRHDRKVALKVLRPELGGEVGAERFLREIQIAAGLSHPNIVSLIDSGEVDGLLFYVMFQVEGESLRERLAQERQLPVDEALRIARLVGVALTHAHGRGVIHRDIKPGNILLEGDRVQVTDFGIAKALQGAGEGHLTRTGLAIGTPLYVSPEQGGGGEDVDGRADIYSLACVLYEMLAGEAAVRWSDPTRDPGAEDAGPAAWFVPPSLPRWRRRFSERSVRPRRIDKRAWPSSSKAFRPLAPSPPSLGRLGRGVPGSTRGRASSRS